MNKKEIISQVALSLKHLNIDKVILFGSYAVDKQKEDSDIDLLVVTKDMFIPDSFSQKMALKVKIAKALNTLREYHDIDLIVHTKLMHEQFLKLNSGFKKNLLDKGNVIYEAGN